MTARLTDGMAPYTGEIECGGAKHRLTWRPGGVRVEEHDEVSEKVLEALGSAAPMCIEAAMAWQRALADPGSFTHLSDPRDVASRRKQSVEEAHELAGWAARAVGTLGDHPILSAEEPSVAADIRRQMRAATGAQVTSVALSHLPAPFLRRLLIDLVDAAPASSDAPTMILRLSALTVLRRIAPRGDARFLPVVNISGDGAPAVGALERRFELRLPLTWLRDVWLPDQARIEGWFVLDLARDGERAGRARLLRIEDDGAHGRPVIATGMVERRGGWRIASLEHEEPA